MLPSVNHLHLTVAHGSVVPPDRHRQREENSVGLLDRLSRLIRANVNDVIDQAEDPEKMINQLLREMGTGITSARAHVLATVAQQKDLEADIEQTRRLAREWEKKARAAIQANKDDLAREALRRKRDNEQSASLYEQQLQVHRQMVTKHKQQLRQLESKYRTTLSQRDSLVARHRRAKATEKVATTLSTFSPFDPSADLDRMERKIRSRESKVAALVEMADESFEAQFQVLEDPEIERELRALKSGGTRGAIGAGEQDALPYLDLLPLDEFDIEAELRALEDKQESSISAWTGTPSL